MHCNRNNDHLNRSNCRRQYQTVIITVRHDNCTNQTGRNPPAGLMRILQGVILIGKLNIKCLREAIAKIMRCTSLQRLSIMHQSFDGIGCNCTGEFIAFRLSALNNWHCQRLFTEICIYVQHLFCFCKCLFCGCMNGMSFLPQEFSRTQERTSSLFPTNHADPLVIQFRQIPIAMHDLCIVVAEQGF